LTACLDKDGQSLAEKTKERWEGHDQALITTTRKETKSKENMIRFSWCNENGRRSSNMSVPPFFQSVGQRNSLFWGRKEGPTVVIWERL